MKNEIYFNVHVSQYFNVPFSNKGETVLVKADYVLNCPIVSWDIDTIKMLTSYGTWMIILAGQGDGVWLVEPEPEDAPKQSKPDTEKWNNPSPESPKNNKLSNFLFI